jgi:hypothetical protein
MLRPVVQKYSHQTTEDDDVRIIPLGERAGRAMHKCMICGMQRLFGFGVPERSKHLLLCANCNKHTWHSYLYVY